MQYTGDTEGSDRGRGSGDVPPLMIGEYRVIGKLGEGTFGIVYLAEQIEPRREVAIKLLRTMTPSARERFRREVQSLALMEHPNIARVYDTGEMSDGRPYIVMELVRGRPITDHSNAEGIGSRGRLELFGQVCAAVQHAHLRGVIHRDLKPSNVLVMNVDARPLAKVIDFGIARSVDSNEGSGPGSSGGSRKLEGTPAYMSPEQARGTQGVDIRADVYSLGVILYEMLAGALPIDPETLKNKSAREVDQAINESRPVPLSTRLGQTQTREGAVAARAFDPATLAPLQRRELDWVVMKCLAKDVRNRYQSAADLGDDIGRYLEGRAIEAAPQSRAYRARKFVARNRGAVAAAAIVLITLVTGLGGTLYALSERSAALARATEEERKARREALRSAAVRKLFIEDVLGAVRPEVSEGHEVTVREMMDRAVPLIDSVEDVSVRADLHQEVGRVYMALGAYDSAYPHLKQALELRESDSYATPHEVAGNLIQFADACSALEREDWGLKYAERAMQVVTEEYGPASPETFRAMTYLSEINFRRGSFAEAEQLATNAVFGFSQIEDEGKESAGHAAALVIAARVLHMPKGQYAEAAAAFKRAADVSRRLGRSELSIAEHLGNYARAAAYAGIEGGGVAEIEEAVAIARRMLDADSPPLAGFLMDQGAIYMRADRAAESERVIREALSIYEGSMKPESEAVASAYLVLGGSLGKQDRFVEGVAALDKARGMYRAKFGSDDGRTLNAQSLLGEMMGFAGQHEEAALLLREVMAQLEASGNLGDLYVRTRNRLALLSNLMGDEAE